MQAAGWKVFLRIASFLLKQRFIHYFVEKGVTYQ
jgi:hypothetical protein